MTKLNFFPKQQGLLETTLNQWVILNAVKITVERLLKVQVSFHFYRETKTCQFLPTRSHNNENCLPCTGDRTNHSSRNDDDSSGLNTLRYATTRCHTATDVAVIDPNLTTRIQCGIVMIYGDRRCCCHSDDDVYRAHIVRPHARPRYQSLLCECGEVIALITQQWLITRSYVHALNDATWWVVCSTDMFRLFTIITGLDRRCSWTRARATQRVDLLYFKFDSAFGNFPHSLYLPNLNCQ